jgi:WD40 repeat protein
MHPTARRSLRRRSIVTGPILIVLLSLPGVVTAKQFSAWGPASAETSINSTDADGCPIESPDGLSLYFASNRPGAVGGYPTDPNDIWRAQRSSTDAAWGTAEHLPQPVNSAVADFCPTPLNGKYLLFVSARSGGCGVPPTGDIYLTRDNPAHGWETPMNLGCSPTGPNTAGGEFSPSLVETAQGTLLFYSSPGPNGFQDIYVSTRQANGSFGPGTAVAELNTLAADQMPNVSRDGLEIVFSSNRTGSTGGSLDVYTAHRASTSDPWSVPDNVGSNVNTGADETRASLSGDGERLHFGRSGDIYVSTRTKLTGSD